MVPLWHNLGSMNCWKKSSSRACFSSLNLIGGDDEWQQSGTPKCAGWLCLRELHLPAGSEPPRCHGKFWVLGRQDWVADAFWAANCANIPCQRYDLHMIFIWSNWSNIPSTWGCDWACYTNGVFKVFFHLVWIWRKNQSFVWTALPRTCTNSLLWWGAEPGVKSWANPRPRWAKWSGGIFHYENGNVGLGK